MSIPNRRIKQMLVAVSVGAASLSVPAFADVPRHLATALQGSADQGVAGFYRARENRPLWTDGDRVNEPATQALVEILRRASLDGMEDGDAIASRVEQSIARIGVGQTASGAADRAADLAAVELILSDAWVRYVRVLRRPVNVGMVYAAGTASPAAPFTAQILTEAGAARDLAAHLRTASRLNPVYDQLRAGLAALRGKSVPIAGLTALTPSEVEARVMLNLDRARALPVTHDGSFILVDTASARMFWYKDGQVRDSMRVVVGKAAEATPMLASFIQHAVLNPFWNIPPDLVRKRVAAGVLANGVGSLAAKRFELLADWSADPRPLDAASVDWRAVAAGTKEVRVRQLPGANNAMGAVKYMFPNDHGIYLHDTPDKSIFSSVDRNLSSGCIRVEDAARLGAWLFGRMPKPVTAAPEQIVALTTPMPVYVTYLTAAWDGRTFSYVKDSYNRDAAARRPVAAAKYGDAH